MSHRDCPPARPQTIKRALGDIDTPGNGWLTLGVVRGPTVAIDRMLTSVSEMSIVAGLLLSGMIGVLWVNEADSPPARQTRSLAYTLVVQPPHPADSTAARVMPHRREFACSAVCGTGTPRTHL